MEKNLFIAEDVGAGLGFFTIEVDTSDNVWLALFALPIVPGRLDFIRLLLVSRGIIWHNCHS